MKTFAHEDTRRKHEEANHLFVFSSCVFLGKIIVPEGGV